ncbi:MAG TPA: gamma-glutamyltransferase [Bryobacteraceae bacterium]|jgi:gamma-glutamyltranspeptidase/glutathione hydrolase|nr:gamma-glutamyltransferase [Bryobacteraceae bacterium]
MQSARYPQWIACLLLSTLISAPGFATEPVKAKHAMVVTLEPLAADVGVNVLKSGGNAVDAAVAVGFALAVTHPYAGNIGGGGFMLVRMANGQTAFIDFREEAPLQAGHDMYLGKDGQPTRESIEGWRSSGVPGSVAGFDYAHKKFGSKPWAQLLAPAVKLASDGFVVDDYFSQQLQSARNLGGNPESKRIFQRGGNFYKAGDTIKQTELGATLQRIANSGAKEFYEGETARRFAEAMQANHGLITLADLKAYKAVDRKPLEGAYKGYHIITGPPPSAGGVGLLQMMGMLTGTNYDSDGPDSAKAVHYEAEAMRRFYADRSEYLGDPAFYNVPLSALLDPAYITKRRATISPDHETPSDMVDPGLPRSESAGLYWKESSETTHYDILDAQGNAVAVTYTLNGGFGNGITVPGLGFLLNNEMDDFVAKPGSPNMFGLVGGEANAIAPGKRPLSSMTPTIIMRDGKVFMVVGAPGGSRITTGVMEVILDVLDFHMNPQDAVDLPRFHEQWRPDYLYLQRGFNPTAAKELEGMGYEIRPTDSVARVVTLVNDNGTLEGGVEPNNHGKVAGY